MSFQNFHVDYYANTECKKKKKKELLTRMVTNSKCPSGHCVGTPEGHTSGSPGWEGVSLG